MESNNLELIIRLSFFFGIFAIMALWELKSPRRPLRSSRQFRWLNNIGLTFFNTLLLRLLFPAAAVGVALYASQQQWGLLNQTDLPLWFEIILAVIILDFCIYLQHRLFHRVPMLWQLHMMHHSDVDLDVTSGARFHPIEIILSMLIKMMLICLLGPAIVAVVIFEVILNAVAMFNHSNVRIPLHIDRVLRRFVVTPDMHRVHHSVIKGETNSNYGFNLPWWDRLFGSYCAQPSKGHDDMTIGLTQFQQPQTQ
ncbi:Fatty acid hydroxylase family (carotene hydroxylase/sterol desaturase), partial [hydrothermal vent metagenome]